MMTLLSIGQIMNPQEQARLLFWLGILMVAVIVGGVGIMLLRRAFRDPEVSKGPVDVGFSLSGLREMRDRGEITPEEYDLARAKIVAKVKESIAPPPGKRGPDDASGDPGQPKKAP